MSTRAATVLIAALLAALAAVPVASILHGERLRAASVAPQAADCAEAMDHAIRNARAAERSNLNPTRQSTALVSLAWSAVYRNACP